jgi:hypothetical protein
MQPQDSQYSYTLPSSGTPEWFNAVPDQPGSTGPVQTPPNRRRRRLIIVAISLTFLVLSVASALIVRNLTTGLPCLTNDDYSDLTGSKPKDTISPQAFYAATIEYVLGTDDLAPDTAEDSENLIKKIGSFYAERASNRSVIVTISSDFSDDDSRRIADSRLNALSDALIRAGVEASAIAIRDPTSFESFTTSDELNEEFDAPVASTAYVSISSAQNCRQ